MEINISFAGHSFKQHISVEYLGCQLDSELSGEVMALKVLKKINVILKFLYCQSRYLTPVYRRLFCNVQHFDYGCSSWFPLFLKNLKLKFQKAQSKCIRFSLNLPPRSHIEPLHFRKINWLPVSDRVEYCIRNTIFKYWNGTLPGNIHDMFKPSF